MILSVYKSVQFCFYVSLCLFFSNAMVNIPKHDSVEAVWAFGDSFFDSGNNNFLNTLIKADFPPYGKDFMGGVSSGRFTNDRTISDYIVKKLGVKDYLPAYLDPYIREKDLPTGVCFASAGSGYDGVTSQIQNVMPLSIQLEMFKEYIWKLNRIVGEEAAKHIIKNGVYLVSSSSNDWSISYGLVPVRRLQYNATDYANLLAKNARMFFEELYKLGARKLVVFGTPYIGCFPLMRTVFGGVRRNCVNMFNEDAETFNKMLKSQLEYLRSSLPHSTICYVDYFNLSREIIQNHLQYGFEDVDNACCGTGLYETSYLCNRLSPICPNDSKFLFWDSLHLTDKGYNIVVDHALPQLIQCLH
ncbi:hypothetical protein Lser_V15G22207 [Lactuca serriola]